MQHLRAFRIAVVFCVSFVAPVALLAQAVLIPTDARQADLLKAYKFALAQASADYHFAPSTLDTALFPRWGERSVYWITSGPERGSFVYPDVVTSQYAGLTSQPAPAYAWKNETHYAVTFKANARSIAVWKSGLRRNNSSISWEAVYFRNLIESFLVSGISCDINEKEIDSAGLGWPTQLLIIPAFASDGLDWRAHMDSVCVRYPRLSSALHAFLARGGTIYTEGNAVYMIEKLGLLPPGSIDYSRSVQPDPASGRVAIDIVDASHPVGTSFTAGNTDMYAGDIPLVDAPGARVLARLAGTGTPVVFALTGSTARGGRVVCNTALPTVGASNALQQGATGSALREMQWALNSIMYAFATSVDVTRSVYNDVPDSLSCGHNAASFDRADTLEIRVTLRNLGANPVSGITVRESIRDYFRFVDVVTPGIVSQYSKPAVTFSGISLPAHGEKVIVYRITTPDPADAIHGSVDKYISWANYIYASLAQVSYSDDEGAVSYVKYRNYVDMLFSARLAADTDCNWKNFLGLYYQPFKVFMIMENKERTAAMGTRYVQYIPKDVPFYWTDGTLDIPILKTPGGKFVDVLRGSNSESAPEFDMDSDGHPDAWLDTASIFPKNYTIEETAVYWLNPWEHLRSGNTALYEDIDHDGLRAQDTDGDGVVDVEEPGDKIRVWKVTWPVGTVAGYQFHDPYCAYELWIDPPDLVPMAAGIAKARGSLDEDVPGMFYPYSRPGQSPNLQDTSWTHWMERDAAGLIPWKQLVYQSIHNYEGFTFIDTAKSRYTLRPTDRCAGTVPQPHREFIAVLSLGGEEIDMNTYTPSRSLYSNLEYTTIFGETRHTPIRTTYTYYAPLPNPLQFEYITNNFTITDSTNTRVLPTLPAYGKAQLTFDIDASTEYTYYWIRNAGHDVDFNDPSLAIEGNEALGDGVFGYFLYDIPKGVGGYKITLPRRPDGGYDIDRIVSIDGGKYQPWIVNARTQDSVSILEDAFAYHVFIPQLLIPPALDDDNNDGVDDWIDDRGDRFQSRTGFLHDAFMTGNGEAYPNEPAVPFKDDIYGWVTSGWSSGADGTYGDDFFENLGKRHIRISAQYEGLGREGPVDISKGGWLVVEEIFGGSPWVLFSHALSAYAEGVNITMTSSVTPSVARFGVDTVYVKHLIEDKAEPHLFDVNFDPFIVARGYGKTSITTYAGGKDPCGLITPAANLSTIIDPIRNKQTLTLLPQADPKNPDMAGYPKTLSGTFIEARIEISNGTDYNWIGTTVTPMIPPELGATSVEMVYVSYPRPLVPAMVDPVTGAVLRGGDDPTVFRTGWRFNQPEGEVLVKMGNELNLLQPTRRAYFVFLFKLDEGLKRGVYSIPFSLNGAVRKYDGSFIEQASYAVAPLMFSIGRRDVRGNVSEYQKLVIGQGRLEDIRTNTVPGALEGLENARYAPRDAQYLEFDTLATRLPASFDAAQGIETVSLSGLGPFPTLGLTRLTVLEQARVTSTSTADLLPVTKGEMLRHTPEPAVLASLTQRPLSVSIVGPKLTVYKTITDVHGRALRDGVVPQFRPEETREVQVLFEVTNQGSAIAENVNLVAGHGPLFRPQSSALPAQCSSNNDELTARLAPLLPGETRQLRVLYELRPETCGGVYDSSAVIRSMQVLYNGAYPVAGKMQKRVFTVPDPTQLDLPAYDVTIDEVTSTPRSGCQGHLVRVDVSYSNGVAMMDRCALSIDAVVNGLDTTRVGTVMVDRIDARSRGSVSMMYLIPDSALSVEFFAAADDAASFGEICESNNTHSMRLPLRGPDWMLALEHYPNPARGAIRFSYTLPGMLRELSLTVFTLDAKQMLTVPSLPSSMGAHQVLLPDALLPPGTYVCRFDAIDERGLAQSKTTRLVKIR
ncbi:MAG: hypothetical protein HY962_09590 [Ignavibacteriae bacterium]|nr:hypothetical protein [Ignavibacteriota bacterium]